MGVQRADGGAGRDAALLEVEGVSAGPGAGVAHAAEGERDVFGEGVVFAGGGAGFGFGEGGDGDDVHGGKRRRESEFKAGSQRAQSSDTEF